MPETTTTTRQQDVSLQDVIDTHIHVAPDNRPRWFTGMELARRAVAARMAGFVLKNHDRSTVAEVREIRQAYPNLQVFGGLVLNRSTGGINAENVHAEIEAGARIIWLPTRDGMGERRHRGEGGGLGLLTDAGEPVPELYVIFELVADADAVLATGHAAGEEVTAVIRAAGRAGVRRILVNHPEIPFLHFGTDLQKQWRDEGAVIERCYPRPEAKAGFAQIADECHEVGVNASLLATDLGRADLPNPLEGMRELIHQLHQHGVTDDELVVMTRTNPVRLLLPE